MDFFNIKRRARTSGARAFRIIVIYITILSRQICIEDRDKYARSLTT